jgi:malonyl-CoA O-methyltransferase
MDAPLPASGAQPAAVIAHLGRAAKSPAPPWLHGEVARRMAARLPLIKTRPQRALDWWSFLGHGEALRTCYPEARIERFEPTAAMVRRAVVRSPWWHPRRWLTRPPPPWSRENPPPAGQAELLWANMTLHWQAEPLEALQRWHASLAVDGFLMFSCFGPDTLRQLRRLYAQAGWGPPAHDFIDMHDLGDAMVRAGFAEPVMDMERLTLTWADATSLLQELRGLGGNAAPGRFAGLRTPRWRERLLQQLTRELTGPDGRLALDFEIVYGHAFKPAPRLAVAPQVRVAPETLRQMARSARGRRD